MSSVWQCYCGYCCSDARVKLCLKNLKLSLQSSCFQTPMILACNSTSNVQVSCLRISFCISQAVCAAAELPLLKIRLPSPLHCLPEWAAICPGRPFPTASYQCSELSVVAHFALNIFVLHVHSKPANHILYFHLHSSSQRYSIVNATCRDLGTNCLN